MADSAFKPVYGAYEHTQDSADVSWVITHNINTNAPIVDCYIDVSGEMTKIIPAEVTVTAPGVVTVTFSQAQSGIAFVI